MKNIKSLIKADEEVVDEYKDEVKKGAKIEKEHKGMLTKLKDYFEKNKSLPDDEQVYEWIAEDYKFILENVKKEALK